jgi:hypothetical protein
MGQVGGFRTLLGRFLTDNYRQRKGTYGKRSDCDERKDKFQE